MSDSESKEELAMVELRVTVAYQTKKLDELRARIRELEAEASRHRDAEVAALEARIAELESLIRRCAPKLAEIMRMPNIEYVADAHNKAVKELRGVLR